MTIEPIDVLANLRIYLTGQAALTATLTNASYIFATPGIPDKIVSLMPCKIITYLQAGGRTHGFQTPLTTARMELRCYGATFIEAHLVERKLASVLDKHNNIAIGDNCIFSAAKATEAQDLMEPDTGWPFCWIPYDITMNQVVT